MVYEANLYKNKFKKYLKTLITADNNDDWYFEEGFDYGYLLDNLDKDLNKFVVFVDKDDNITNFAFHTVENDLDIFYLDTADKNILKDNLDDLRNSYKHPFVDGLQSFYDDRELFKNIFKIDCNSKIVNERYVFNGDYFCLKEDDKSLIVDIADKLNFPPIGNITYDIEDYSPFIYEKMRQKNLIPTETIDDSNHNHIAGFHYFGLIDDSKDKMVVAKSGENIIGIIKYGIYGDKGNEHIGLCFIDVSIPYRGNKIATNLMEKFGNIIYEENKDREKPLPIYLTEESEMGRLCHMKDIAIDKIKDVPIYYEDHKTWEYVSCFNGVEIDRNKYFNELKLYGVKDSKENEILSLD